MSVFSSPQMGLRQLVGKLESLDVEQGTLDLGTGLEASAEALCSGTC